MEDRYVKVSFSLLSIALKVELELSAYEDDDKMPIGCSQNLIGYNRTALANGTAIVPLNFASNGFLAQLNFNYHASNGSLPRILGPIFTVDDSSQSTAVTWSQGVLAAPTHSPSAVPQTSTVVSLLTSSASTASAASSSPSVSKSSTTSNSGLGTGAIAGIVVGIIACVGLAAALVFWWRRKSKKIQEEVRTTSSDHIQAPIPVHFIGEKDATPLQPPELSGDCQRVEMATSYHGEINVSTS